MLNDVPWINTNIGGRYKILNKTLTNLGSSKLETVSPSIGHYLHLILGSGVPRQWRNQEFCSGRGRGVQQIQLRTEDRENGDLGAVAPLVMGSGGSCNLVQEISFHIVKVSNFLYFKNIYDDNQFICHC